MSALNSSEHTTFLIECPKCHLMASGEMVFAEPSKHYREVVLTAYPSRIVCNRCGFAREYVSPAETIDWDSAERSRYFDYTLWLRTEFDGHQLWAKNLSHLLALEAYLKKPNQSSRPFCRHHLPVRHDSFVVSGSWINLPSHGYHLPDGHGL